MKQIIYIILLTFLIQGCSLQTEQELQEQLNELRTKNEKQIQIKKTYRSVRFNNPPLNSNTGLNSFIVEIDSCEYVFIVKSRGYASTGYMAHKGNCKFCTERNKIINDNK